MKIKTKLALGLGFLFAVIILLAGLGAYFTNKLSAESKAILQDNHESLEYIKNMQQALDMLATADTLSQATALANFKKNLALQKANITEVGEQETTRAMQEHFDFLQRAIVAKANAPNITYELTQIRQSLYKLTNLNMQAIVRKNNDAQVTAKKVITYFLIIGTISVLVTLTFILNFPGYIANPIRELS